MSDPEQVAAKTSSVLDNPSARVVARTYAEAFLDAAGSVASVPEVLEEFQSFVDDVLAANPDFRDILNSEIIKSDVKLGLIDRTAGPSASEFFGNFLRVITRHDRLVLLPLIVEECQHLYEIRTGRQRVQVISATTLSDQQKQQIYDRLNDSLSFDPILEFETDDSLLGGLVIRIGDSVFDTSLRTRVRQLRARLRERNLHEIQSGRDRFSYPEGN